MNEFIREFLGNYLFCWENQDRNFVASVENCIFQMQNMNKIIKATSQQNVNKYVVGPSILVRKWERICQQSGSP